MRNPDELRALVEGYLSELVLTPELHGQAESMRYALSVGGKRVRPVICLATMEAAVATENPARVRMNGRVIETNPLLMPYGRTRKKKTNGAVDSR